MESVLVQNAMEDSNVNSLPAAELEYEIKQALKNKDYCMLNLSIHGKTPEGYEAGHATGIYQEKAGGPIIFYDPEEEIKKVKNIHDTIEYLNKKYDYFDYFQISKISQISNSLLKTYKLNASWNRLPNYDTLLSLSQKSSQDSHLANERKDFNLLLTF